jgi:hypothetical protein
MERESLEFFGEIPFAKTPRGGNPQPVTPMTIQAQNMPGPTRRQGRALPPPPAGLFAGQLDRPLPENYIESVSPNNWFTPEQPITPFGPPRQSLPREFDYPVGINLDVVPRRQMIFNMLRAIAQGSGILATVIEARIDQMLLLPWSFQLKDQGEKGGGKSKAIDPRIKQLTDFFAMPDRKRPFEVWMRMIFRDRYILDAATAFIWRSADGTTPYAIEPIDGATIKPLIDDYGRRPDYPNPAYQQIIKGLPENNFTEMEMIYHPARPRTEMPIYGYPEVEQIFIEASSSIKKLLYQYNFWEEGTMPDLMLGVPENWTPEQIAVWQATFDALLSGNLREKSKARFIPGGMKPFEIKGSAGELLKCDYDEWLARIVCHAFRISPAPFIKELNRSTSQESANSSDEAGLFVEIQWWKSFMNRLITVGWGYTDIEYVSEPKMEVDPVAQQTTLSGYVKTGELTVNESRDQRGLDPIPGGDVAMVYIATGAVPLEDLATGAVLDLQQQQADATTTTANKPTPKPEAAGKPSQGGTAKAAHPFTRGKRSRYWREY